MRTLIIDGNFFGQRVLRALPNITFKADPKNEAKEFIKACCGHLSNYLTSYSDGLDNIVIVKDARSWRREIPIIRPNTTEAIADYKANRDERLEEEVVDMGTFFKLLEFFFKKIATEFSVPYTCIPGAEGDDAIWAWTQILSQLKRYSVVYCTDSDLTQLVNSYTILHRQVKTKESPYNGEIVCDESYYNYVTKTTEYDIFDSSKSSFLTSEQTFMSGRELNKQVFIRNPYWLVLKKMIVGDSKDNIPPVFQWQKETKSGIQTRKVTEKMVENAIDGIFVGDWKTDENMLYDDELLKMILVNIKRMNSLSEMDIDKALAITINNRKLLYLNKKEIPEKLVSELVANIKPQLQKFANIAKLKSTVWLYNLFGIDSTTYFQAF